MTLPELFSVGEREGILTPEQSAHALAQAAIASARPSTPWYLQAFIAFGAWLTSIFLLAFIVGLFQELLRSHTAGIWLGLAIVAGATVWRRLARGVFPRQLCLALSTAGQLLFFYHVAELDGWRGFMDLLTISAALMAAVLYPVYPDRLHRFLSTLFALVMTTLRIQFLSNPSLSFKTAQEAYLSAPYGWFEVSVIGHLTLLYFIFGRPGARLHWRPLGYAAAVSLLWLFLVPAAAGIVGLHSYGGPMIGLSSIFIVLATLLSAGGWHRARRNRQVWLALSIALLIMAFTAGPATLVALFFLVLGFGLQDRAFLALGTLLLPTFLFFHYYNLAQSLAQKSAYLLATGLVLLALRFVLTRVHWAQETTAASPPAQ